MPKYETYTQVKKVYNVSPETVRNWARKGQIRYKVIQNEKRKTWLFDIESIGEHLQQNTNTIETQGQKGCVSSTRVLYVRVSSAKQSADLERQRELLSSAFPGSKVISDIGSGLNFHKPGITKLVRDICRDKISQVVVTFKDRIARFGYELFEQVCKEHSCSILVYGDGMGAEIKNDESELKDDLLAIVNVFVASNNGKRAAALRKERKRLETEKAGTNGNNQGETVSNKSTEEKV